MVLHKATEGPKNLYEHFSSVLTEETSEDMPVMSESKYPDMHTFKSTSKKLMQDLKVRKKAMVRNRYNQIPYLAQDTIWKSDKTPRKHHIQENSEASPFPAGDHKVARNRPDSNTDMEHK